MIIYLNKIKLLLKIVIFASMQKWSFILVLFIVFGAKAQERNFTVWNKNNISVNPWDRVSLDVAEKIHYTPERNSVDLKYGEVFIGYEPKGWLEYGFGFRHSYLNLQNGNWLNENRPMMFLSLSKGMKTFELVFSNRLEYRTFKQSNDYLRHKQSLKLEFPNITEWGMQFYVSEESYYKLNGIGTHLARFYTGIKALDKEHFDMKLYYSLQKSKSADSWLSSDILGLNLSFSI